MVVLYHYVYNWIYEFKMKVFVKYKKESGEVDEHIFYNLRSISDNFDKYTFIEDDGSEHDMHSDKIVSIQVVTDEKVVSFTPIVDIRVEYPQNLNEFVKDIATMCVKHKLPIDVELVIGDGHVKFKLDKDGRKTND